MTATPLATHLARASARLWPGVLWRVPTRERKLFLTFDDGPTRTGTPALLNLLDRYGAKASFFVVGQAAQTYPHLVQALAEAGHTVGNHTHTHLDPWRSTAAHVRADLEQGNSVLAALLAAPVRWTRPPYGHLTRGMQRWCTAQAQTLVMWDVLGGDFWPAPSMEARVQYLTRSVRPGSVVVLHDNARFHAQTLPLTEAFLSTLSAAGWQFEHLDALKPTPTS